MPKGRKTYSKESYRGVLPDSTLRYVLEGLLAVYSDANLKLAFRPTLFFADIEKISNKKQQSIKNEYYKAIKTGLIKLDERKLPRVTEAGRAKLKPYKPKYLGQDARLLVIFDIPENERWKRNRLRLLLRELCFEQIQKSVWVTKDDSREYLIAEIKQLQLEDCVEIYEAKHLKLT